MKVYYTYQRIILFESKLVSIGVSFGSPLEPVPFEDGREFILVISY